MSKSPFNQVAIIGVGLIGGSLGLAIKRRFPRTKVIGVDKPRVLKRARQRGAIDTGTRNLSDAVRSSDLVILAAPVSSILRLLPAVASHSSPHTVVTDVGSVKSVVASKASMLFTAGNFIGGHPMAGVELSGIEAAHPLLFENAVYVLTSTKETKSEHLRRLSEFLKALGARVLVMDAKTHDSVASAVSHVPQLLAVAMMNMAGKHREARDYLRLGAGGFRDMTRIASSRFDIWADILPLNRKEVKASLRLLVAELRRYERFLNGRSTRPLRSRFDSARRLRDSIPRTMKGFLHPLAEVYVYVKDQPGMLAAMTMALWKAGLNIKDMELVKVREGSGGTFRISFDSKEAAERGAKVLRKAGFELSD